LNIGSLHIEAIASQHTHILQATTDVIQVDL